MAVRVTLRALLAACLLASCGCAAYWTASKGDAAMQVAAYDDALGYYRAALALDPSPEIQAQIDAARTQAAATHFGDAEQARKAGNLDLARESARLAVYHAPQDARYRQAYAELRRTRSSVTHELEAVRAALRVSDWIKARRLLRPIRSYARTFPEITKASRKVTSELLRLYTQEGRRFMLVRSYAKSAEFYAKALEVQPKNRAARAGLALARARAEARELSRSAAALLAGGDLADAITLSRKAQNLHPESRHARVVLTEALRRTGNDRLRRAKRARDAGDLRQSYVELLRARDLKVPLKGLKGRIHADLSRTGKEIAARYLAEGIALETQGLPGAAWLYYRVADRVKPGFTGVRRRLDLVGRKLAQRSTYRVLVLPPRAGAKTAPRSSARLAVALRRALKAVRARVEVYGPRDLRGRTLAQTGGPPDAVVRGTLHTLWIETTTSTLNLRKRYEAGRVPRLNMRVEELKAEWKEAQAKVPHFDQRLAETERKLYDAEARSKSSDRRTAQQGLVDYGLLLIAFALSKENQLKVQDRAQQRLQDYMQEPAYVFEPYHRDYHYTEVMVRQRVRADATVELKDFAVGKSVGAWRVTKTFVARDSVVAGYRKAGVREDPLELPSDAALLDRGAREIARLVLARLSPLLESHGRFPLEAARQARGQSRDRELHWLATAWQTGARALGDASRREVVQRVRTLTGLDLSTGRVDPARIPTSPLK